MIEMIFTVSIFGIWFYFGIYNLLRWKYVRNRIYFLCWLASLLFIIAASVL